jgi:cell wall assembly regulator SMI1
MRSTSKVAELDLLLDRLDRWLAQHRPHYWTGLLPGADAAALGQLAQALAGRVPPSLEHLLAWHNGQKADFVGCFEASWKLMGTQAIVSAKRDLDGQAAAAGWQSAWIPFLDDDAGDYLCLDTAQAEAPVLSFWQGRNNHPIVAASLTAWTRALVQSVESGEYVEDPERGYFLRRHPRDRGRPGPASKS